MLFFPFLLSPQKENKISEAFALFVFLSCCSAGGCVPAEGKPTFSKRGCSHCWRAHSLCGPSDTPHAPAEPH